MWPNNIVKSLHYWNRWNYSVNRVRLMNFSLSTKWRHSWLCQCFVFKLCAHLKLFHDNNLLAHSISVSFSIPELLVLTENAYKLEETCHVKINIIRPKILLKSFNYTTNQQHQSRTNKPIIYVYTAQFFRKSTMFSVFLK